MPMDALSFARSRQELRENLENRRGIAMTAEELRMFLAAADKLDAMQAAVKAVLWAIDDDGEMQDFRPGAHDRLGKAIRDLRALTGYTP